MSESNPTKQKLRDWTGCRSYATHIHPNPKLYKYYWRIFSKDSKHQGADFFRLVPELSTAECMSKMHALDARKEPYLLYNRHIPRRFEGMPFDPHHGRWQNTEWAPAWEDDTDAISEGFK
jgi:hypothetical protein